MDTENLRVRNMSEIRAARNQKFGFYDKLCIVTERVKVFSNLFLGKKPKYLKNINEMKNAKKQRIQLEKKRDNLKLTENSHSPEPSPDKMSDSNVNCDSKMNLNEINQRPVNI